MGMALVKLRSMANLYWCFLFIIAVCIPIADIVCFYFIDQSPWLITGPAVGVEPTNAGVDGSSSLDVENQTTIMPVNSNNDETENKTNEIKSGNKLSLKDYKCASKEMASRYWPIIFVSFVMQQLYQNNLLHSFLISTSTTYAGLSASEGMAQGENINLMNTLIMFGIGLSQLVPFFSNILTKKSFLSLGDPIKCGIYLYVDRHCRIGIQCISTHCGVGNLCLNFCFHALAKSTGLLFLSFYSQRQSIDRSLQ